MGSLFFSFRNYFFLRKHSTWPYGRKYTFFSSLVFTIIVSPAALHSLAVISKESLSGPRPLRQPPPPSCSPISSFRCYRGNQINSKSSRGPQTHFETNFGFFNKIFFPSKNAKKVFFSVLSPLKPYPIPNSTKLFCSGGDRFQIIWRFWLSETFWAPPVYVRPPNIGKFTLSIVSRRVRH